MRVIGFKFFLHTSLCMQIVSTQQETQQPTAQGWTGQCAAYGAQTQTQPETNLSLGALASFPDCSVRWVLSHVCLLVTFSLPLHLISYSSLLSHPAPVYVSSVLYSPFSPFLKLSVYQTYGSVTWWSWCWRSLYPRSPIVSVTCCCARLGFYWACSTATSLCERSVRLMSTGESFRTFFDLLIVWNPLNLYFYIVCLNVFSYFRQDHILLL